MDNALRELITNADLLSAPIKSSILILVLLWSFIWKGLALWYAAKAGEKKWFIATLILNTAGVLEIAYLFYFKKEKMTLEKLYANIKNIRIYSRKK